ncbi:helix-turn-helix domain-containing protein [Microbacterium sp. LMI1x-1-1.1]
MTSAPTESAVSPAVMAKTLGVSYQVVLRMAHEGQIPAFMVGARWRMFPSEVIAHLRAATPGVVRHETPALPRPASGAHAPDDPGESNLHQALEFLSKIDPAGALSQREAAERARRAGFF